ncbi:MAG: YicC/YloC family endoribonuclease [Planctomycetota bacterium]
MLRSMTGFGSAGGEVDGVHYVVEARSVNNRYLKPNIRLPEAWMRAEAEIEQLLRKRIARGSVTLTVKMKVPDEQAACTVRTGVLESYADQLKQIEAGGDTSMRIDLAGLLLLPGVMEPPSLEGLVETTRDEVFTLIHQAIDGLIEMRQAEGQGLAEDLLNHCAVIREHLGEIEKRSGQVVVDYHQRLTERVEELTRQAKLNLDEDALSREVALFAERSDIAEEVNRLGGHLDQFRQATELDEPAGRKMDFIAQEMLREANTIGSKANDADISRRVVEIKSAVDRIKEQVQNAE